MAESIFLWAWAIMLVIVTLLGEVPGVIENIKINDACKEVKRVTGFSISRTDILFLGTRECTGGRLISVSFEPDGTWEIRFRECDKPLQTRLSDRRMLKRIAHGMRISATDTADATIRVIECSMDGRGIIRILDMTKLRLTAGQPSQGNKDPDAEAKASETKTEDGHGEIERGSKEKHEPAAEDLASSPRRDSGKS